MKADFKDERGFRKFRVTSATTKMMQDQRRELHKQEVEANRIKRVQARLAKKYEGMASLF